MSAELLDERTFRYNLEVWNLIVICLNRTVSRGGRTMPGKNRRKELRFHIHEYTPHTLPMERLAEYLKNLAVLLGGTQEVHFVRLEAGSVSCALETEVTEQP